MSKVIGIDLGTTNSAAAVVHGGKPVVIPSSTENSPQGKPFPSAVALGAQGNWYVGEMARLQAQWNGEGSVLGIKRKMGTDWTVTLHERQYTPQEISSYILKKIRRDAEAFLKGPVAHAVITVPAYFNDNQRQATKDAGTLAGLEVIRVINEPTAACLAYGFGRSAEEQLVVVFDLGGGTLDVTVMEIAENFFEVRSTSGDTHLGGMDMDALLVKHLEKELVEKFGISLSEDPTLLQRAIQLVEMAKVDLSHVERVSLNLDFLLPGEAKQRGRLNLTRVNLEEIITPIVKRCEGPVHCALKDAGVTPEEVQAVVLVGGPTRMPIIRRLLENTFGQKLYTSIDPMLCVSYGAAIQGAMLEGEIKEALLLDVVPISLGIESEGGIFTKIIPRNATIPTKRNQVFTTVVDNQPGISVRVFQGERAMAADNVPLGQFDLEDLPPVPRGVPQIEVTFEADANGILQVSAEDLMTGQKQEITIQAPLKMSPQEVTRLLREARRAEEEDKTQLERTDAVNEARFVSYAVSGFLEKYNGQVPEESRKSLQGCRDALEAAIVRRETPDLKKIILETTSAFSKTVKMVQVGKETSVPRGRVELPWA